MIRWDGDCERRLVGATGGEDQVDSARLGHEVDKETGRFLEKYGHNRSNIANLQGLTDLHHSSNSFFLFVPLRTTKQVAGPKQSTHMAGRSASAAST